MASYEIESLNAEAATWFASSSFLEASKRWCHLLRLLVPHLHVQSATLDESDANLASGASDFALRFVNVPQLDTVDGEHAFAVFRCGIVFTFTGTTPGSSWGAREYRKLAIATCYNMAVAHHLHGLQDANHAASLDKALKGYRLALGLLESIVPDVTAESQDVIVLALAIANNEGHVHACRFDLVGAHECWLDLQRLLQHAAPTHETMHFFATVATVPGDTGIFSLHAPVA